MFVLTDRVDSPECVEVEVSYGVDAVDFQRHAIVAVQKPAAKIGLIQLCTLTFE
jgi:hypothetical protein